MTDTLAKFDELSKPAIALPPTIARRIVDRMGQTGQPPDRGALAVNVGTDEFLDVLRHEYLRPIKETGCGSTFKLVQAPFGGGKTQFLSCVREIASQEGFLTTFVNVSPQECPFDDPVRIYTAVMRSLRLPPASLDEEPSQGFDVVLRAMILDRAEKYGEATLREWLASELRQANFESRAFQKAVRGYAEAVLDDDEAREDLLRAFFFAERADATALAAAGVRETVDSHNAFRMLRSLTQCARTFGLPGIVLLFDEMDRTMSLSSKRKRSIGDNLRQMIDHCGQSTLPNVLWLYAVPPEFMTLVVPEYPALAQRLVSAGRFGPTSPLQPVIDLDHLPLSAKELFRKIGERLLELYELGYGHRFDPAIQRPNIEALASDLAQSSFETGARRTFVRCVVHLLSNQHRDEERALDRADIRKLTSSSAPTLEPMDGEREIGG